ncbi:hypothetical protein GGE48_005669 [Rhizobium leguminosarum]|nr:hypothetical protein [Rhizobium leguminosarum]
MSDTDRRPLMEAPQMCVHYCEEKECEEWGGWGNRPSPAVATRWSISHTSHTSRNRHSGGS